MTVGHESIPGADDCTPASAATSATGARVDASLAAEARTASSAERTRRRAPRAHGLAVRPRTLLIAMAVILAVVALAVFLSLRGGRAPGRVTLARLSEDSTSSVGFAGSFPGPGDDRLANPLGIATDGERLFVAESDAGVVRVFDEAGGRLGTIGLTPAGDAAVVYPAVVAVAGERLAVVDTASNRVIVVDAEPAEKAEVRFTLGGEVDAPAQPVSVAFGDGEYFVFDAADALVKVFDGAGELVRTLGEDLDPAPSFPGGMAYLDGRLYIADSNGGRVVVLDADTGDLAGVFPERYALPRGIMPLTDGALAIVDTFARSVFIVDAEGDLLHTIDAASVPDGVLESPRGSAWLGDDSRLYVTDAATGLVMVYNVRLD